jgi:hypothetical protein
MPHLGYRPGKDRQGIAPFSRGRRGSPPCRPDGWDVEEQNRAGLGQRLEVTGVAKVAASIPGWDRRNPLPFQADEGAGRDGGFALRWSLTVEPQGGRNPPRCIGKQPACPIEGASLDANPFGAASDADHQHGGRALGEGRLQRLGKSRIGGAQDERAHREPGDAMPAEMSDLPSKSLARVARHAGERAEPGDEEMPPRHSPISVAMASAPAAGEDSPRATPASASAVCLRTSGEPTSRWCRRSWTRAHIHFTS